MGGEFWKNKEKKILWKLRGERDFWREIVSCFLLLRDKRKIESVRWV